MQVNGREAEAVGDELLQPGLVARLVRLHPLVLERLQLLAYVVVGHRRRLPQRAAAERTSRGP
jgi:hypothetical protein